MRLRCLVKLGTPLNTSIKSIKNHSGSHAQSGTKSAGRAAPNLGAGSFIPNVYVSVERHASHTSDLPRPLQGDLHLLFAILRHIWVGRYSAKVDFQLVAFVAKDLQN
jgi:hypothetical protein